MIFIERTPVRIHQRVRFPGLGNQHRHGVRQGPAGHDQKFQGVIERRGLAAARLKEIHAKHGGEAIGFVGSNRTSNEENFLFQRLARETFGSANIDHHRTADYTGLMTALGEHARQIEPPGAHVDMRLATALARIELQLGVGDAGAAEAVSSEKPCRRGTSGIRD